MEKKQRNFPARMKIRNKYPLMVAAVFFIYIFLFAFTLIFAAQVGPGLMAQEEEVTKLPTVTSQDVPVEYAYIGVENENMKKGPLMLVNGNVPCEIDGINLVSLLQHSNDTYKVSDYEVKINSAIVENINNMLGDFYKVKGANDIMINSGYRDAELQDELHQEELETLNEEDAIKKVETSDLVAKPGYSEHQTGYVVDFSLHDSEGIITEFTGEGEYSWIQENCAKYGFVLRYTADKSDITGYAAESWHFRYVGQPHAEYMTQNNLALEEYLNLLKSYTAQNPLTVTDLELNNWNIYYVAAEAGANTQIPVSHDNEYSISGNNVDGFIVSVKLK